MSYKVIQCQIAQDSLIYDYCDSNAQKAKLLYNAALFRIRQIFTGWDKDSRTDNEKEVFAEVALLQQTYPSVKVKKVISYGHLEKLMRVTHNPDCCQTCRNRFLKLAEILKGLQAGSVKVFRKTADAALPEA